MLVPSSEDTTARNTNEIATSTIWIQLHTHIPFWESFQILTTFRNHMNPSYKQPYSYSGLNQSCINLQSMTQDKPTTIPGGCSALANGDIHHKGYDRNQVTKEFLNTRTNTTAISLSTCHLYLKHHKLYHLCK